MTPEERREILTEAASAMGRYRSLLPSPIVTPLAALLNLVGELCERVDAVEYGARSGELARDELHAHAQYDGAHRA